MATESVEQERDPLLPDSVAIQTVVTVEELMRLGLSMLAAAVDLLGYGEVASVGHCWPSLPVRVELDLLMERLNSFQSFFLGQVMEAVLLPARMVEIRTLAVLVSYTQVWVRHRLQVERRVWVRLMVDLFLAEMVQSTLSAHSVEAGVVEVSSVEVEAVENPFQFSEWVVKEVVDPVS